MSNVEETHLDVLQNMEFTIVRHYREEPALIDLDVQDAVEALIRHYSAEEGQRHAAEPQLADRPARLFGALKETCEWRLGRAHLADLAAQPGARLAVTDLLECLKRIRKSIRRWNREYGRQGYLKFVSQYVG